MGNLAGSEQQWVPFQRAVRDTAAKAAKIFQNDAIGS
jgi:hypothetical protein